MVCVHAKCTKTKLHLFELIAIAQFPIKRPVHSIFHLILENHIRPLFHLGFGHVTDCGVKLTRFNQFVATDLEISELLRIVALEVSNDL